jgi:hypothetical protein
MAVQIEEGDIDAYYGRIISRISDGLDNASCIAVTLRVSRETYLDACARSFDLIERWHQSLVKEATK